MIWLKLLYNFFDSNGIVFAKVDVLKVQGTLSECLLDGRCMVPGMVAPWSPKPQCGFESWMSICVVQSFCSPPFNVKKLDSAMRIPS